MHTSRFYHALLTWLVMQLVLVNRKGPILHDNAWPHIAQLMLQKLNKLGTRLCLICHIHLCQGTFNFKESYMLFSVSQGPSVPYQFLENRNEQSCMQFSGLRPWGGMHTWIPFSNLFTFLLNYLVMFLFPVHGLSSGPVTIVIPLVTVVMYLVSVFFTQLYFSA